MLKFHRVPVETVHFVDEGLLTVIPCAILLDAEELHTLLDVSLTCTLNLEEWWHTRILIDFKKPVFVLIRCAIFFLICITNQA